MKKKTLRNEERIITALILRKQGMTPAQIKRFMKIEDWKTVWRIFNVYASDYDVDNPLDARQ